VARSKNDIVSLLLKRYGRTYFAEIGIDIAENDPEALFEALVAVILFSAPIRSSSATRAAQALMANGLTSPHRMSSMSWDERARILNRGGYARLDERTSTMLGDTSGYLLEKYDGDLRNLREAAGRQPPEERRLLKEFKGVGDVAVDIFFREAQLAWKELFPFADERVMRAARQLGLADSVQELSSLVGRKDFLRLAAALVRAELAGKLEELAGRRAPKRAANWTTCRGKSYKRRSKRSGARPFPDGQAGACPSDSGQNRKGPKTSSHPVNTDGARSNRLSELSLYPPSGWQADCPAIGCP
jgi:endonuclease III